MTNRPKVGTGDDHCSSGTDRFTIVHAFADYGVESEALSAHGDVYRFTIDPRPNEYVTETVTMDLLEETPDVKADLGLFHPKCTRYSEMTSISGEPEEHENQIPRAREIARETCEHWIIENKSNAPLEDATVLDGKMFGLPIAYERGFETSFPVEAPPRFGELPTECSTYFSADRSKAWWRTTKGYLGDYPKEHLVKNCLPAAYVHCLVRSWLKAVNDRDAAVAQNNNGRAPPKVADDQSTLVQLTDGGNDRYVDTGSDRSESEEEA